MEAERRQCWLIMRIPQAPSFLLLRRCAGKFHVPVICQMESLCFPPLRDGRVLGVLEVSRSIGDGQYKRCGVTSVPDIRRCQLTPNDRFILLACDGLFKVFTPEEAVNFILSCLEDEKIQSREGKPTVDARYEAACNRLASKAVQRGSADNVTVMVVRIGSP